MAKKPAITGLARPEGIIDDLFAPLGKQAVKRTRQAVRGYIKQNNRVINSKKLNTFDAKEKRAFERASDEFDANIYHGIRSGKEPFKTWEKEYLRRNHSSSAAKALKQAIDEEREAVRVRKNVRAVKRQVRKELAPKRKYK
jgi:Fe-S cluster biosynthesis and repair protein YggX